MSARLVRAWACYWIVEAIGFVTRPVPRSHTKSRIVNALTNPFFPYAAYYALRSNPQVRDLIKRLEKGGRP